MLKQILREFPDEALPRYSLALEYSNSGEHQQAMNEFQNLFAKHPDYTAGYLMAAQVATKMNDREAARRMLTTGIASAQRTSNGHAESEMQAMLDTL